VISSDAMPSFVASRAEPTLHLCRPGVLPFDGSYLALPTCSLSRRINS